MHLKKGLKAKIPSGHLPTTTTLASYPYLITPACTATWWSHWEGLQTECPCLPPLREIVRIPPTQLWGWQQTSWVPLEGVEIRVVSLEESFSSTTGLGVLAEQGMTDPLPHQCQPARQGAPQ